jgi:drug/metabolite transporter (DMT)-like permease
VRGVAGRAIALALASTLFFTMTYVLNRASVSGGGHWQWAVILRYLATLPLLAVAMPAFGGLGALPRELRTHARPWLAWSAVGFVLFGIPLTWAASSGPSWLVAGSFGATVLAGPLLAPFIYRDARRRVAWPSLAVGVVILLGILALQWGEASGQLDASAWLAVGAVVLAAFAYPLGNRKLLLHLEHSGTPVNALQRVFGMTLCSWPWWLAFGAWTWWQVGPPGPREALLAGGVALSSGVVATVMFFKATDMVGRQPVALAAVEAMQAAELLFATLLGVSFLGEAWPAGLAAWGAVAIVVGIAAFSWISAREASVISPQAGTHRPPVIPAQAGTQGDGDEGVASTGR